METYQIISAVLTVVAVLFGGYLSSAKKAIKDAKDFMAELHEALQDNTITQEEWQELGAALGKIIGNFSSKQGRKNAVEGVKDVNKNRKQRK